MKTITDYELAIKNLHRELSTIPDNREQIERKLKLQLRGWVDNLDIIIHVAKNETTPWQDNELGYVTVPMELKKSSQRAQVGDYQAYLKDYDKYAGLLVERKTIHDLYGTLMNRKKRDRFYREVSRYESDPRFSQMMIMVEGSRAEFIGYVPKVYIFQWESVPGIGLKKLSKYIKSYYNLEFKETQILKGLTNSEIYGNNGINTFKIQLIKDGIAKFYIDGVDRDTWIWETKYGKYDLYQLKGSSAEAKRGTLAGLIARGIHIEWTGSRDEATKEYKYLVEQWIIKNYQEIIKMERE